MNTVRLYLQANIGTGYEVKHTTVRDITQIGDIAHDLQAFCDAVLEAVPEPKPVADNDLNPFAREEVE